MEPLTAKLRRAVPAPVRDTLRRRFGTPRPWDPFFDFTAPPPPPGTVVGAPDYVGVGAQKAGTSWWSTLIASHPQVATWDAAHKERHFFDRFWDQPFRDADVLAYHRWFPRAPGALMGEWTPEYLFLPWVAPLLRRAAPDAKLLVLLRDPVDRFRSGVQHVLARRKAADWRVAAEAFQRGLYAQQLTALYEHFDRAQVLVLLYEQCRAEPAAQLRRTYEFLSVDADFVTETSRAVNVTRDASFELDADLRAELVDRYRADVHALAALHPELDLSLWRNCASAR